MPANNGNSPQIIIAGFSSLNFVPGAYGEVKYGAGASSAASIPLKLLCSGLMATTGGTWTPDVTVTQVLDVLSASNGGGVGGQLTRMVQGALGVQGVSVWAAPIANPNTPTAATIVLTISAAAQTIAGTLTLRVGGVVTQTGIAVGDTATTICTNVAQQINNTANLMATAVGGAGIVTITCLTTGAGGNNYEAYLDLSICPGITATLSGPLWTSLTPSVTNVAIGSFIVPSVANGFYYKATTGGIIGASQPAFTTTIGTTVTDGAAVWTCWGRLLTGGVTSFGGGAGVESATNVLANIKATQFDRIALGHNDATNLALWVTQVNAQAGPLTGLLQHVICGTTGTLASATTLATVTLNAQRFQLMWYLNGETHLSEMVAQFAALRTQAEQTDPDAMYDGQQFNNSPSGTTFGVFPQSQRADWATNATASSALNNGITPIGTTTNGASAYVIRSITSHSLNGSIPDYSTLDTGWAVVPDFILTDLKLYWLTFYLPANPRVAPDLPVGAPAYPSGVATPKGWNASVSLRLAAYAAGTLGGTTVPPIIYNVANNPPVATYDYIANRIMSAVTVYPMPSDHQIGISVRQSH